MTSSQQSNIIKLSDIWKPHPVQKKLIDILHYLPSSKWGVHEAFYGGGRAGGKTTFLLGLCLYRLGHPKRGQYESVLFLRRTFTELQQVVIASHQLFGKIAKYNIQQRTWKFNTGGILRFAYLENTLDAMNYQGSEYTIICVDEAGTFPSSEGIMLLKGSLRSTHNIPVHLVMTGNPAGPGHHWLYKRYVEHCPEGNRIIKLQGLKVIFVPSLIDDNPSFHGEMKEDYIRRLKDTGSERIVRAWLYGKWDLGYGAFFDCWSQENIIPMVPIKDFPEGAFTSSIDWGSRSPCSIGWWFVPRRDWIHPTSNRLIKSGTLIRCHELYLSAEDDVKAGLHYTASEVARLMLQEESLHGIVVSDRVGDPSMQRADGGSSIAVMMAEEGVFVRAVDNTRVSRHNILAGWGKMYKMIKDRDLLVMDNCVKCIEILPGLPPNPRNPEDLDSNSNDHMADEIRYMVNTIITEMDYNISRYKATINPNFHPVMLTPYDRSTYH